MRRPRTILTLVVLLLVQTAGVRAEEAPHARAYADRLDAALTRVAQQTPQIVRAAEAAAAALDNGHGFGVRGDDGLGNELSNRAGAMLGYDGRRGQGGDVIFYVFGVARAGGFEGPELLRQQIARAAALRAEGSVVIGLGSRARIIEGGLIEEAEANCDVLLDNAYGPAEAELDAPIETVLNAAVAWTFQCELFAALTRLDRVPVVRLGFEIDTRHRRWLRYGTQPFHHDRWLDPIPAGKLGHDYLDGLRAVLRDITTASWRRLNRAAGAAHNTLAGDDTVWLRAGGRYLPFHVGGQLAADPGLFTLLTHDGSNPNLPAPGAGDYVIAVGRHEAAGSHEWGEPELLRKAGRGVAWVVNGYNTQPADLMRREVLVDLWGPVGDCVVKVADYDANLGPVSGVTAEAVTWMIAAEVRGRLSSRDDRPTPLR